LSEPLAYLNGRTLPASAAHLQVYDAGVVLGATVSELTRTFRHQPFRLEDHLERLFRALRYVRFDIGMSQEDLADISRKLLAHNAELVGGEDELGLIHFVTAGEYPTYAGIAGRAPRTTICAHTFRLPFEMWADKMPEGAHLVTPATRHIPQECYPASIKCRSRMHYYLADQEARLVDPNATALLLDLAGNVTETNGANFLMVERGTIVSPLSAKILPGISRQTVIELAARLGIPLVERDCPVADVVKADEAFLTSTPYCLLPATHINGVAIGDGRPGPMFERLIQAWSESVGLDIRAQILAAAGPAA
jgi:branched-subunit amino acid aminotransferase/4-amino-4-deoxychorismate lyase